MKKVWVYKGLQIVFSLAMIGGAIGNLIQSEAVIESLTILGYPPYLSIILGIAYILGVVSILQTKIPLLREWAFSGFTIALLGAFASHLFADDPIGKSIPPLVLLAIMFAGYFLEKQALGSKEGSTT